MGNLHSLKSAIKYLGVESKISNNENELLNASHIFLPGVGSFKKAMEIIKERKIDKILKKAVYETNIKLFGICLGMQLLGSHSEEDNGAEGLNFIQNKITRFDKNNSSLKIPHVGFNKVNFNYSSKDNIFYNLKDDSFFYFVHSYKMEITPSLSNYSSTIYGEKFISAFQKDNLIGTQFHPELSQSNGIKIIDNFLKL